MSTQPNPPADQPPTMPQVQQMAEAGGVAAGAAVERGATPDEVRKIVADAMAANARTNRVTVDDDTIQTIAHATIAQLEQAGAFEPPPAPPAGGATHPAAAAAVPVDGDASTAAGTGAPVVEGEAPRRTTFADRFLGHKPR